MSSFQKKIMTGAVLLAAVVALSAVAATNAVKTPVCVLPTEIKWSGNPQSHGLKTALLYGDPTIPQPYAERIKIPANMRLKPHRHSNDVRLVTVLSGTLYFAFGEKFDESQLKAFPPGTFFVEPKDAAHYSLTKDEEVVLQLDAIGPEGTTYVK